jgi:hypothetical protein
MTDHVGKRVVYSSQSQDLSPSNKQASGSVETRLDSQVASGQKEHFFKLVQEYGYWLGSPEDNEAIGLSTNWRRLGSRPERG